MAKCWRRGEKPARAPRRRAADRRLVPVPLTAHRRSKASADFGRRGHDHPLAPEMTLVRPQSGADRLHPTSTAARSPWPDRAERPLQAADGCMDHAVHAHSHFGSLSPDYVMVAPAPGRPQNDMWLLEAPGRGRTFVPAQQSATPATGSDRAAGQGTRRAHSIMHKAAAARSSTDCPVTRRDAAPSASGMAGPITPSSRPHSAPHGYPGLRFRRAAHRPGPLHLPARPRRRRTALRPRPGVTDTESTAAKEMP